MSDIDPQQQDNLQDQIYEEQPPPQPIEAPLQNLMEVMYV